MKLDGLAKYAATPEKKTKGIGKAVVRVVPPRT